MHAGMAECKGIPPRNLSAGTNKTPPIPTLPIRMPTKNTTDVNNGGKNIRGIIEGYNTNGFYGLN
jgi:hypothetical protein|tara:strand:- start:3525 stop:3719 length:195 start_codon:yes stop_codon:yes gene_type:complete